MALVVVFGLFVLALWLDVERAQAAPCDAPVVNEIVCENSKPGNPPSEWDVSGAGSPDIQGFATDISVDQGGTVDFKVDTDADDYRLDIYRMGYYGGDGARKVATVEPSASLPQGQPACLGDSATGLVDCGNWAVSASWGVPADAVSGIYFAKLVREDGTAGASHVYFVVRDDDGGSDLLFQTSDTTWQAYNRYGGNSLYTGSPAGRAYKVSYNRPFTTRGPTPEDAPFNTEYPMVRWLERNGYDVSYFTGVDSDRYGSEILEHDAFLSVGHDEYWSGGQRANVTAARDAGVNLAFFSGNESFWKTRWEDSIDGTSTPHRTLVSYKETHANAKIDPTTTWTGTWRDGRAFNPEGPQPENALSGTIFMVNSGTSSIEVPAADAKMRIWRNTGLGALAPGQSATLGTDTLGYEWDEDLDNGSRPPGLIRLSTAVRPGVEVLQDNGSNYAPGTATHHMTLYRAQSGALVFGAGTIQWSWGLDANHDRGSAAPDSRMQQATANLLADMGVQPDTLQSGLTAASASTDTAAPSSQVTSPNAGAEVQAGKQTTISGTATDAGGGEVGGVEVSVNGGSWHPVDGRANWTYTWTPQATGPATIRTRAVDDSANLESPGAGTTVDVVPASCPCSIWDDSMTPPLNSDTGAVELGVKFRSEVAGEITAIRFYKGPGNSGIHVGHLWTGSGTMLAEATFTGESPSGWQEVQFGAPVTIDADTTYVASYHAPNGGYAATSGYFAGQGADSPPLHALADGVDGANGVYNYGPSGVFPTSTYNQANYWVDVVFDDDVGPDTTPPSVNSTVPGGGASGVNPSANLSATFNEAIDPATIDGANFELRDGSGAAVPATVSYSAATHTATLDPDDSLANSTSYTATLKGGASGIADIAANPLGSDFTWSFTTAAAPPPPPDEGPGGPILVIGNSANPFSRYYAEILRAEGLNEFNVTDLSGVDAAMLDSYDVVILGEAALSPAQAQVLSDWVTGGGNLVAMRPDADLVGLLGLTASGSSLSEGYLKVDTGASPGEGITGETMQFHGAADRYTASDAATIATLYSDGTTATSNPAVTLRNVGPNGGQAAAFTYDLARSIVHTRQGNPAWAGQSRDGQAGPIRADNLFFGAAAGDPQADWVDRDKIAIPQADEQQRLLANLIGKMNSDRAPLPRFWYFPRGEKAVVVMTGDDHAGGGTAGRFDQYEALSPAGCSVADWECVRSTSYVYPNSPLTDAQAAGYEAGGFEVALHQSTNCSDFTPQLLDQQYDDQLASFASEYPSVSAPQTSRSHCIAWSDWATQPKVEYDHGIRLDTNYYYWPPSWVNDTPGLFTGSAMPMRFADLDGSMIDVYQAPTQMTDESGQSYPLTIDTLLDRALGSQGYYGTYVANMHTDSASSSGSDAIVSSALSRGVPIVSSRQMLTWLDGRNGSSFNAIDWANDELQFSIEVGAGANGLQAMVPVSSTAGTLTGIKRDGSAVPTTTRTVKGVEYAFVDAAPGNYVATYEVDQTGPAISNVNAVSTGDGTTVTWDTDEASDSRVDYGTSPGALDSSKSSAGLGTSHSVQLDGLDPGTTYYYRVTSADGFANSTTDPPTGQAPRSFTTADAALTDTTASDFAAGSTGADIAVTETGDGELSLKPAGGSSQTWESQGGGAGGSAAVSGGALHVNGAFAGTDATFSAPRTLEFDATFGAASFQHAGFSDNFNSVWAIFSTANSSSQLFARVNNGSSQADIPIPGSLIGSEHRYRIEWGASEVRFYVDGSLVATQAAIFSTAMNAVASDFASGGAGLDVEWMRIGPYPASGSFESRVLDAGSQVNWQALSWSADTPAGTGVAISIRTGNTATPDAGWSAFNPVASSGDAIGGSSRYIQYRAVLSTGDPAITPSIRDVTISETEADDPPTAVDDEATVAEDAPPSAIDVLANDRNDDGGPLTITAVTDPEHGTVTISPAGGTLHYSPAADYCNSGAATDDFTYTINGGSQAWVRVRVECVDDEAPDAPTISSTIPASPANENNPAVKGAVGGGDPVQVRIYASADCTGPAIAGSVAAFAGAGIAVTVADDTATSLSATAVDAAGNASACSDPFTYVEDSTAPETTIDSGPSGSTSDATPTFAFSASEPGSTFKCRFDSATFGPCSGPGATHTAANDLAPGSHVFRVRAIDPAGNSDSTAAHRSFTVEGAPPAGPVITATNPASPGKSSRPHVIGTLPSIGTLGGVSIYTNGSCNGPAATKKAAAKFTAGGIVVPVPDDQATIFTATVIIDGRTSACSDPFTYVEDSTAPETTIDSGPSGSTSDATPTFAFSASEPGSTFKCRFDSATFGPCSGPGATHTAANDLAPGSHVFRVRAIDPAGNSDSTAAHRSFTVEG